MPPKRKLNVFISSTSEDLKSYRAVSRLVVLDMEWMPIMMEHFGAMAEPTVQACCDRLSEADLVLLIVAFRRGWVPTVEQGGNGEDSVTARELAFARSKKIPVLAMLANDSWPGKLWEEDAGARKWIKAFRDGLNLPAVFFDYEQEAAAGAAESLPIFRGKVRETLVSYREDLLKQDNGGGVTDSGVDYFDSANEALAEGGTIPFLGTGVYTDGLLNDIALTRALSGDTGGIKAGNSQDAKDGSCLATMAEYREQYLKERQRFLGKFRTVIQTQSDQVTTLPLIYQLLLKVKPPSLIISATCDLVFEHTLEAQGKSYVLVCHVVRSHNKEQDGKIMVFRGRKPEFCVADKIDTKGCDYVIYKPLGSPLLHDLVDPDLEIDTVVVTETDHLILLGRLEHELTQIPTAFSRLLQRRSLLFAGYSLDIWQYRLVMQVFDLLRAQGGHPTSMAIREPATQMEELAWTRLGSDLIRLSPDDFANRALNKLAQVQKASSHGD